MSGPPRRRPRLAVFKLTSCDGCQVSVLNLGPRLLELAEHFELAYFLEASSRCEPGPYDLALVEGSVTTPAEVERLRAIREQTRVLVAIGACATTGGIQALRNVPGADVETWKAARYPDPEHVETLPTSTPLSDHVRVDHEIHGCPVNTDQVWRVLVRAALGTVPDLPRGSVCIECKKLGRVCVVVSRGLPCLGPVTRAGCGALCPALGRDCYGCFGPSADPHVDALARQLEAQGHSRRDVIRRLQGITGQAPAFRTAVERLEAEGG